MERSQNKEHLDPYSILADYYDALLGDKDGFKIWIDALKKYTKGVKVLDLASGSAIFASMMQDEGYDVMASDISLDMQKAAQANFSGSYVILDMRDLKLKRTFDIITCVCDSVNYLDRASFQSFLKSSYKALNDEGYLFFDMHDVKRLDEFKEAYVEEGKIKDTSYIWTIEADELSFELFEHFSFFIRDHEYKEEHHQFVYECETIEEMMREAGFDVLVLKDFIKDEKVLMVGVKR